MQPLSEHQILVFFIQLLVLLGVARALGALMRRVGQPAVVGELAAGLLLGPSVFGVVAPDLFGSFLPADDPVQGALLQSVAWVGVALLLVVTGFETDLGLLRHLGRQTLFVSAGSIVVPLAVTFGFALLLPGDFLSADVNRSTFALFIALSMSISALAVIGKILGELGLMRRNVGQVSLASAMANDLVGWLLLGTFVGLVHDGGFNLGGLLLTLAAIGVFLGLMLTVGQRLVDGALRRARSYDVTVAPLTVILVVAFASGVVTQYIGVEAVLGAFVAGVVVVRSRYLTDGARESLESLTAAFFAPLFFATAGLRVDLSVMTAATAAWVVAAIVVAMLAKSAGAFLGGLVAALAPRENLAVAVGLNARGTLEIVVATVALSLGVFSQTAYTLVIVLAMTTSLLTPALLRLVLRRLEPGAEEAARLEREAVLGASVIASTRQALLPTRGGANSLLAARMLDMALQPATAVTVLTVGAGDGEGDSAERANIAASEVAACFHGRTTERINRPPGDAAEAICTEAALGYGLVAVGMTEGYRGTHAISTTLRDVLASCPVPMLFVKTGVGLDPHTEQLPFRRILVPATGTKVGQAAQEIAFTLAARLDAAVDVVHVVSRPDQVEPMPVGAPGDSAQRVLSEARSLAAKYGRRVTPIQRTSPSVGMELALTAHERDADVLVLGAKVRTSAGQPFLGHGVEYLLEHSEQTVIAVVFPEAPDGE